MSDLQVQGNTKIVIVKDYGITHALKKLVEDNPNAVMTNGKISTEQWIHTMKALDAIQQKRLENNQSPIFSGGTDKSSDGWHTSYVVHPNQEIEFTPEEMTSLYNSMGVQINQPEEIVVATPEQVQAVQDSRRRNKIQYKLHSSNLRLQPNSLMNSKDIPSPGDKSEILRQTAAKIL